MRRLEYDGEFFFLRSSLGAVSKGATPVKYTDICHFEQTGINAEKFQNTRIRFNSDAFANLTVVTFKANLEQIGINAEKFQNTRIRLNSDVFANLTVVTFNALYIPNERVTSILSLLKLLWSKEENYDDSLEELFIPTKHCGFKSNKMQSIYFRFRIQNLWRLDQTRIYYYYQFLDSSIYVCKRSLKLWKAIDVLQSMNPKRPQKILQIT